MKMKRSVLIRKRQLNFKGSI